jgi:hypothetical protein
MPRPAALLTPIRGQYTGPLSLDLFSLLQCGYGLLGRELMRIAVFRASVARRFAHGVGPSIRTTGRIRSHIFGAARTVRLEVRCNNPCRRIVIASARCLGQAVAARLA